MTEWQDISTAPKDGRYVLVWFPYDKDVSSGHALVVTFDYTEDGTDHWYPERMPNKTNGTHWASIEPPSEEGS